MGLNFCPSNALQSLRSSSLYIPSWYSTRWFGRYISVFGFEGRSASESLAFRAWISAKPVEEKIGSSILSSQHSNFMNASYFHSHCPIHHKGGTLWELRWKGMRNTYSSLSGVNWSLHSPIWQNLREWGSYFAQELIVIIIVPNCQFLD